MLHRVSGGAFGPLASQMAPVVSQQTGNAPVQTSSSSSSSVCLSALGLVVCPDQKESIRKYYSKYYIWSFRAG